MSHHQHLYLDSSRGRGRPGSMRSVTSTASGSASCSRRPPPALRGAACRAHRAHAHVSLVSVTGDQLSLPTASAVPQGLRRAVSGASPVEEALSRQLDRDTAGQHLGLRSRRSSAATLASMRTDYTSHPLPPQTEEEEHSPALAKDRKQQQQQNSHNPIRDPHHHHTHTSRSSSSSSAVPSRIEPPAASPAPAAASHPSTPPQRHLAVPDAPSATASLASTPQGTPQRRSSLNPKTSSAWLRWSSPAPTFPKKDKGKAKEQLAEEGASVDTPTAVTSAALQAQLGSSPARSSPAPTAPAALSSSAGQVPSPIPSAQPNGPSPTGPPPTQPPPRPATTRTSSLPATPQAPSDAQSNTESNTKSTSKAKSPQPTVPTTPAHLNASTSSTIRSEEADVSRLLDPPAASRETDTAAMDSGGDKDKSTSDAAAADNKPDPSLELPPPARPSSIRGWRIPFWSSSEPAEPAPAPKVRAPLPKGEDAAVTENKAKDATTTKDADVITPQATNTSSQPPDIPKTSQTETTATSGKGPDASANGPAAGTMTNGSASTGSAKRRKIDESGARASAPVTEPSPAEPTTPVQQPSETAVAPEEGKGEAADAKADATTAHAQQPMGWGSYLASFVYRTEPPAAPTASTSGEPEQPGTEDTEMKPADEPESAPTLAPPIALDQPMAPSQASASQASKQKAPASAATAAAPAQPPAPTSASEPEAPPPQPDASPAPPPPTVATSTSSTGGWLSYLAFRASQKKITGSTLSGDKGGEAEEVMDFSADPDFPSAEAAPAPPTAASAPPSTAPKADPKDVKGKGKDKVAEKKEGSASTKDAKVEPKDAAGLTPDAKGQAPNKTLGHKRSQNLALATRRQSNASSVRSNTPVPLSPRTTAAKTNSALPNPPQAKQPNLVIPNFETTFDRPPRSLMPRTAQDGVTATAWRALSYVTGSIGSKDPPGETRGLKEGRDVGANLPRRIGLGGVGSPDDGWKNVHRVVVVGVHGWFPAKLLNSVIGEPTGTSVKFATMMGEAVKKFFKEKGVDEGDIRLTLIPLEGEGVIDDRVDKLYKAYLSNPAWINDVRRADAVLFAAHSQGCIVTTHLISRMIAQGHIRTAHNRDAVARCEWAFGPIAIVPSEDSKRGRKLAAGLSGAEGGRQKVVMLAMCGVHLGPFLSISTSSVIGPYLTWFENAAARELFEFQDTESAVSQAYQRALAMILENEVRVVLLASLNDQVVPIYGASFSAASHPLLLRALFVDGASFTASDFMTNLICFAFMLRNAGIDDQRLVEHLSEATAGSLTGVGHSTPYEELGCYSLAVHYLFHTGPAPQPLPPLEVEPFSARDARNDFELPWIMRALVDAAEVKDLFPDELRDLKASILAWKPATKPLKEIKRRLEPMAGRPRTRVVAGESKRSSLLASAANGSSTSLASMGNPETPHPPAKKQPQSRLASASGWADNQAYGTRR